MTDAHLNFAYSAVATAPSPATSGLSLVVTAADGAKFPAVPFNATIWPTATQPTSANAEIVRVTTVSTDTLTIARAQQGSSARTVVVGDQIAATITAQELAWAERVVQPGLMPAGALAETWPRSGTVTNTGGAASSGVLRLVAIDLPAYLSIASITFLSSTTVASGTHGWFALFDSSRALLRQSADDTSLSWGASSLKTYTLSSPFVTTYSGLHYLGCLVVGTPPNFIGCNDTVSVAGGLAPILAGNSTGSLTATAPNPAGAISSLGFRPYAYVS